MTNTKAFTTEYTGIVNVLNTQCGVCVAYKHEQDGVVSHVVECDAIWDTGAMGSVISSRLVEVLNLKPIGKAKVYHVNGMSVVNTYLVNIILPNNIQIQSVLVTEGVLDDTNMLIGMDIISLGDFSVTSSQGRTKFSFQVPSTHDIDYTKEAMA